MNLFKLISATSREQIHPLAIGIVNECALVKKFDVLGHFKYKDHNKNEVEV